MTWTRVFLEHRLLARGVHVARSKLGGSEEPPARVGLIGMGDTLHYNSGQPNTAPVHPLHSQFWHLDWDGDGRLDLLVSTENPSDQPLGEAVHLFDRAFLDNNLPTATLGKVEKRNDPM